MISPMMSDASRLDFPRRLFTVDEVSRMVELGILGEDERVELLDGELLIVSPQSPSHAARLGALALALSDAYRPHADVHVRQQMPLDARPHSLPEPDLAVVKGNHLDYQERHPIGGEAHLVVEVARTSQALDRRKTRIYATAGVPVYWLIDLVARQIEVFSGPSEGGTFAQRRVLGRDETIDLPGLDVFLAVSAIVG
jgi:Uma2 family endonuclease